MVQDVIPQLLETIGFTKKDGSDDPTNFYVRPYTGVSGPLATSLPMDGKCGGTTNVASTDNSLQKIGNYTWLVRTQIYDDGTKDIFYCAINETNNVLFVYAAEDPVTTSDFSSVSSNLKAFAGTVIMFDPERVSE
jgi:hypothetical protein